MRDTHSSVIKASNAHSRKMMLEGWAHDANSFSLQNGTGAATHYYASTGQDEHPQLINCSALPAFISATNTVQLFEVQQCLQPVERVIIANFIEAKKPQIITPAEMINTVRDVFMLKISEAAKVFRVTRPTIYQWMDLMDIEQIRARQDRERMIELFSLAKQWAMKGKLIGRWLSYPLRSGKSVLELLSEEKIDHQNLLGVHAQLLASSDILRSAEHKRALKAAEEMRGAFAKLAANQKERERGRS